MVIKFPRGIEIDIDNVPDDFESIINKSFKEYTSGTSESYTYQDKLAYIDRCRQLLHKAEDEYDAINNLVKETFCDRFDELGEFTDESEFMSVDFMAQCYKEGANNLCAHYTGDHHKDDKIMKLLERAIKVVINY